YFRNFPYDYPFEKLKADPERAIYPAPEANMARAPRGFLFKLPGVTRRMLAAEKTLDRAAQELPDQLEQFHFPRMAALAREEWGRDLTRLSDAECLAAFEHLRAALFDDFAPQ